MRSSCATTTRTTSKAASASQVVLGLVLVARGDHRSVGLDRCREKRSSLRLSSLYSQYTVLFAIPLPREVSNTGPFACSPCS